MRFQEHKTGAAVSTLAVLLLLLVPAPCEAQIVNVQSVLATEAQEGISGSIKTSVDWRTGNVDILRLTGLGTARFKHGQHLVVAILKGDFGKASGTRYLAKSFEHIRYRLHLSDLVTFESFVQHEYDQFRRLELRALLGIGAALRLLSSKRYNLSWGVAYMPEYERIRDDDESDAGAEYINNRVSSYILGAIELNKRVQLVQTIYAQPRVDELDDIRLLSESQFVVQITERLAQTTAFVAAYDSRPPAAIEKLDTSLKSSLTYSF